MLLGGIALGLSDCAQTVPNLKEHVEFPSRVLQVAIRNNVVTVKDRASLVAADGHRHALGNTSPDKIADARTT